MFIKQAKRMKIWGALLLISCYYQTFSQIHITLVDKQDYEAVAFAELHNLSRQEHYMSNIDGIAELVAQASDTIKIHALGYVDITMSNISHDTIISLERNIQKLAEVEVVARLDENKSESSGNHSNKKETNIAVQAGNTFSYQSGLLIKNTDSIAIRSVSFYVSKKSVIDSPYRLRIYSADSDMKTEPVDLLDSSIIHTVSCTNCWESIPLSPIVTNGNILVALEWLPSKLNDPTNYTTPINNSVLQGLQFSFSYNKELQECFTYSKKVSNNKTRGWYLNCMQHSPFVPKNKVINFMIHIESVKLRASNVQ